jgi:hypothetical protein
MMHGQQNIKFNKSVVLNAYLALCQPDEGPLYMSRNTLQYYFI